jgi:hypothetical protein
MPLHPGEGERRAASGYRPQYLVGAGIILRALNSGDLEWIRVADPKAGHVDDLQLATTARIDGYQVKWSQYGGTITLSDLVNGTDEEPALMTQLASGWRTLQALYPHRRVVVHLVTNKYPSTSPRGMPHTNSAPTPNHLAGFIEQAWVPAFHNRKLEINIEWAAIWEKLRAASGLTNEEFARFVYDCSLDFRTLLPSEGPEITALVDRLFKTAADPEKIVELSRPELLRRLGWSDKYTYRNIHEFPDPQFLYKPIQDSVLDINKALQQLSGGYIGVFGPPGSGKSTLLTRTLRLLPVRLVRYYAYVPEAQDPSVLRGESINFLHDVTTRLWEAGFQRLYKPDATDRSALLAVLHHQLQLLGDDYVQSGTKTVIMVDGLDHIAREQSPERSLLRDLPLPDALPEGVYIILGSQPVGLAELPVAISRTLQQEDRQIEVGRLKPTDIDEIAEVAQPELTPDERQQVYALSSGHPLALIYILKQLRQAEQQEERSSLLAKVIPYAGDIDEQYWAHWHIIENDEALVSALGLLARVRGPIHMKWVARWAEPAVLRKLREILLTFFQQEGDGLWVFFHNSFRLFLESRTIDPLPGQTAEEQHLIYHQKLATYYQGAPEPWLWETLYHRFYARDYAGVVSIATQEWFHEQIDSLRPLDAIQTDVRLALQAAGARGDVVALARLTLAGAAVDQRIQSLEECGLPDLLIKVGESFKAAEHLRDGNRLRVEPEQALGLSVELVTSGLVREGRRLFELAEPLELLSGKVIAGDHSRPQNLWKLMRAWVKSAVVLRGPEEVVQVIRRIRIEPDWRSKDEETVEHATQHFQGWLLAQGALACCDQHNWVAWEVLRSALDSATQREALFAVLLHSAERAESASELDRARSLLTELLATFQPGESRAVRDDWWQINGHLAIAELALWVAEDMSTAQAWIKDLPPIPLVDSGTRQQEMPSLQNLCFRSARLRYLLGEEREPEALLREAEEHTVFGGYTTDEEKAGYRRIGRAFYQLARLWAWGRRGIRLHPFAFLQEVKWILDSVGVMSTRSSTLHMFLAGSRSDILKAIVQCAAVHENEVVAALAYDLEKRWMDSNTRSAWWHGLQREVLASLYAEGMDKTWIISQLQRIEPFMFEGLNTYSRVEECEAQAHAWLALGDRQAAYTQLQRMMRAARGVLDDKDYQLSRWVGWIERVNELQPEQAEARIRLMLRRLVCIHGNASGVTEALESLLAVVFQWRPRRAVRLLKVLLEKHIVSHQDGVATLLRKALSAQSPPLTEVLHSVADLLIPFVPGTEPELIEAVIEQFAKHSSHQDGLDSARYLAQRIRTDVPSNNRPAWLKGVAAGVSSLGASLDQVGIDAAELVEPPSSSESQNDRSLYLTTGEQLALQEAVDQTRTVADLRSLLESWDRTRSQFFEWKPLIGMLIDRLSSVQELRDCHSLIQSHLARDRSSQLLTRLSKRFLVLGDLISARNLAEQALAATEASGWVPYWDGGAKHEALRQYIAVDAGQEYERFARLYAQDVSERFRQPREIIPHLYDILALISPRVPVEAIWPEIETYLDDLFTSTPVEPQPDVEALLEQPAGTLEHDTPARALADLFALYLDHPSYPIAQGAVRACTASLLSNSRAVADALLEALQSTDRVIERALMVLDAASSIKRSAVISCSEVVANLRLSKNFIIRATASSVHAQLNDVSLAVPVVQRATSALYDLHLPPLSRYRTELVARDQSSGHFIDDPARLLSPMDVHARGLAELAQLPPDNVLYRVIQHFHLLKEKQTWLGASDALNEGTVRTFLDQIGLLIAFTKPHISPARHALGYVIAELYDGGYFPPQAWRWLLSPIIIYDPAFILQHPDVRPSDIAPIGGASHPEKSYLRFPNEWTKGAADSLSLLHTHSSDGRVIIGERTQLKQLDESWPREERMSVVRLGRSADLWQGLDVDDGHIPFFRCHHTQIVDYLSINAPLDHLVIAHDDYEFETPGANWLAFNPKLAFDLGWHYVSDGWFRWVDQEGEVVAESVWWADGYFYRYNRHQNSEVGNGWLVLLSKRGLQQVRARSRQLSRGGIVWRGKGGHGDDERQQAIQELPMPY